MMLLDTPSDYSKCIENVCPKAFMSSDAADKTK